MNLLASLVLALATFQVPTAAGSTPAQNPPPAPPTTPPGKSRPPSAGETKAVEPVGADGKALVPGKLPDDASEAARAAWQKTLAASVQAGKERPPIQSFSLDIDAEFKQSVQQVNQVDGNFDFLAASGWVKFRFKSGRGLVRGPDGDWWFDPARGDEGKLTRADEDKQDVRQLDDAAAVARNFLALTNPATLRIGRLALLPAPPSGIPQGFFERARSLTWLEVQSPDFRLSRSMNAANANGLHRVQLGLDPKSSLPMLALILDPSSASALGPATLFLELRDWFVESGYRLPKQIDTYEIESAPAAAIAFRREPTTSVFLKRASINPTLTPDTFRPPKKD